MKIVKETYKGKIIQEYIDLCGEEEFDSIADWYFDNQFTPKNLIRNAEDCEHIYYED